jgi:coenzyme F420-reducing hydrogenase alpha subunit
VTQGTINGLSDRLIQGTHLACVKTTSEFLAAEQGLITEAQLVPPTSQNQSSMELDLVAMGDELWSLPLEAATRRAQHAVRNYDPCISCSTHFLTLAFEQVARG